VVSLVGELDLLLGLQTREEEDAHEVDGLGRRRVVFPLLDLETLPSAVSVDSDCFVTYLNISFLIFTFDSSFFHMVTLDVEVNLWGRVDSKLNALKNFIESQ
jgi:hypothetical protein